MDVGRRREGSRVRAGGGLSVGGAGEVNGLCENLKGEIGGWNLKDGGSGERRVGGRSAVDGTESEVELGGGERELEVEGNGSEMERGAEVRKEGCDGSGGGRSWERGRRNEGRG
ncbi:hypothetical protein Tco_0625066 [Tanacetum coccineum]|uniref:Uncharacterized protein n=1 Tax=Tanacetum coccineum TaxID=301880 RepID=A0ABQ4WFV9_9ASTR